MEPNVPLLETFNYSSVSTSFPWSSVSPLKAFIRDNMLTLSGTVPQFSWKSDAVALWLNWLFLLSPQFLKLEKMLRQRKVHLFNCRISSTNSVSSRIYSTPRNRNSPSISQWSATISPFLNWLNWARKLFAHCRWILLFLSFTLTSQVCW